MESQTLENSLKGALLFTGGYFIFQSIRRIYMLDTNPVSKTSQACTLSMGAVGAAMVSSVVLQ